MRRDKIEIYLHLIWTTWDRHPFITPKLEEPIYDLTRAMLERHNSYTVAIGGVADHLHLLARVASTTVLCEMVKDAKGSSSRWATSQGHTFKWRPTYAAFSVSLWDIEMVKHYILNQKEHHAQGTTDNILEMADEKVEFFDGNWIVVEEQ